MEAQAAVDARTHEGISPLYVALQNGCFSVAQLLIDSGADVDARTLTGNTALHMAATRGLVEVGEMLVQRGCDVNARTSRLHTPLHLAIEHDQLQMALQLLANGAATDARDSLGNSPLHLASRKPLRLRRLSPLLVRSHPPRSPPSLFLRCLLQCLLRRLLRCLLQTMLGATPVAAACAHDLYYESTEYTARAEAWGFVHSRQLKKTILVSISDRPVSLSR